MNSILAVAGVVMKELYRRKDFYVLFVLTAVITLLAGSANFFDNGRIVRFVKEICLLLIWVASLVIAVTVAARHLPLERETRTIFPLLAKPITRTEVLLGKFLGCWLACWLALVLFYTFFGVICLTREPEGALINYIQALLLHWGMLAVVVAMALLGSLVFAAPSSNNTITLVGVTGILLIGRHLHTIALQQPEPQQTFLQAVYFVIPHLELFDVRDLVIHNWPAIPAGIVALALLYAAFYTAFFLSLAAWRFRKLSLA